MEAGKLTPTPQDHSAHTYAPMLTRELSPINWDKSAAAIDCQIRGLIPWPCATTVLNGKTAKIYAAALGAETTAPAGTIVAVGQQGIEIACGDGQTLRILQLQAEGGKRMAAADYLRGHPIEMDHE